MYGSLIRRKRSLMKCLFIDQNKLLNKSKIRRRYSFTIYGKCIFCILILYYLNILIGLKSYLLYEKSFENEYNLRMTHIDVTKIEEDAEKVLGSAINVLSNEYLIPNEYLCVRSPDPESRLYPHLIIFVKSFSKNLKEREAIRLTWGEKNRLLMNNIRLAFVLGQNVDNIIIKDESNKYGDIIQIDQIDSDSYSSYKMVMMLRWINDYCSVKSRRTSFIDLKNYVLFVDDDYYIDFDSLLLYINQIDNDPEMTTYERRTFLTGELIKNSRPERFINDRWYVSIIVYPYNAYPPYISTGCFLMTRYNARLFYIASKYTRLFHFDHIYMGLLAYSMSTKLIQNNQIFSNSLSKNSFWNNQTEIVSKWKEILKKKIYFNSTKKSICYRGYKTDKLIQLWNQIHQTNINF